MEYRVPFLPGEYFWGGSVGCAVEMPLCAGKEYSHDFTRSPSNQTMPMFLSTKGRYIWSEHPFRVWIDGSDFCFDGEDFQLIEAGSCLRDAYLAAMRDHFPFDGKPLPPEFFLTAQYNTWMECTYHPTQEKVLKYAHDLLENGFEPGVLIIDEGWAKDYGIWDFDRAKFPDPAGMIDELHRLGFLVMLWVTPLVAPNGEKFIKQIRRDFNPETYDQMFLRNAEGQVALVNWWNGFSAILDFRKPCDADFLDRQLQHLMQEYGADGFKFDGGSYSMYLPTNIINGTARTDHDPAALNLAWNEFGTRYRYHEYKDTYRGGGKCVIQRLADRNHTWVRNGIDTILPSALLQGLLGHPFICPDMIGGGEWTYSDRPDAQVDEELFIRMAQVSALLPMMQFSWVPWRVLSDAGLETVRQAARLHREMSGIILAQVENARLTGEPIVRSLEYQYPHQGYETVTDQFLLGEDILVCPAVTQCCAEREILLPPGRWIDPDGMIFEGGKSVCLPMPIERLLWFRRKGGKA